MSDFPCWSHYHERFQNGKGFPYAELWKAEKFCDVDVVVGGRTFRAHRIVLAAASAYSRTVFLSEMEHDKQRIPLHADPEVFDHVLELIYCGCYNHKYEEGVLGTGCRVSIDEMRRKVLALAHFLQVVVCEVSKWLAREVDSHPQRYARSDTGRFLSVTDLFAEALVAVAKRLTTSEVKSAGELLQRLPFQVMCSLLQSEYIACREDELLDVLAAWEEQHPDAANVKRLLSMIRFEVMAKDLRSRAEKRLIVQRHQDVLAAIYREAMDGSRRRKRRLN